MAAYYALISLTHILNHILHPPPLNKIMIDTRQIEFLRLKVDSLIDFLETYSRRRRGPEIADLETRIAGAAYEAEDIIESNVLEQIRANGEEETISTLLCEGIQNVLEKVISIEKEAMKLRDMQDIGDLRPQMKVTAASSTAGRITMVGFDKQLNEVMSALATDESERQIIPIVGMGGIGKTTLATAVYNNPFVVEYFHVRAWVTVSQEYSVRELFIRLLSEIKSSPDNESTEDELGLQIHKKLFDRKYLIVLDDMWHIEAWEKLRKFLPHNGNGSRVLVTTRLSNLAQDFESCTPYKMDFLDEGQSWDLLRKTILGDEDCPVELEEIGEDIAKKCSGLPLALVVIGGLLAKLEMTREQWEYVAADVTSALSYGNDEHVMKILSLSYIHLPLCLKPCFLYLAMFPEDFEINVTRLVRLWVAEGLIKHTRAKCLEEVAHEYLEDLISRNLILVHKKGSTGKVRCCKIHDLIRDLCIGEAGKQKFLHSINLDHPINSPNLETKRRLSLFSSSELVELMAIEALQTAELNRSLLSHCRLFGYEWWEREGSVGEFSRNRVVNQIIHGFRLLKVVHVIDSEINIDISNLCNLRHVVSRLASSILMLSKCWNMQTIILDVEVTLPDEIWQMPQLRHLRMTTVTLPDPPVDQNFVVLENLQTFTRIKNFKFAEEVPKRIPNLKKLHIEYDVGSSADFGLQNLVCFEKLESLQVHGAQNLCAGIAFPVSLKKLSLAFCNIPWKGMSIVGSLPNLEVLKLYAHAAIGEKWNPIEGEFCRLKSLTIFGCDLRIWEVEDYHFPSLEHLALTSMNLEELPMSLAEISSLEVIELYPSDSHLWNSAKEISNEREMLGYEPLQLPE